MKETIVSGLTEGISEVFETTSLKDSTTRAEAIAHFKKVGLPTAKTEEYRFTPITRHLEKHFTATDFASPNPSNGAIKSIDEFLIPDYQANRIVFINGQFNESFSNIISPASQVSVKPLTADVLKSNTVAKYFGQIVPASLDPFAAINASFWRSGVFIEVPDNVVVEKPILIIHLSDASESRTINQSRLLVTIGKGSEVTITEKFNSVGTHPIFTNIVEEIEVMENASLNYTSIQNDEGVVFHTSNTRIHQETSSKVAAFTLTLDGQLIRNNLSILVDGEQCESHFNGLYILQKNTIADNHTVVDHLKPNSFSNEMYKGVMDANSKGVFNGKIYVRPHAQKTNAFQSNRNILLSETSTVNTKPQLEIWADDVKCSHGCTSGQLDEEAIFYLQSRGIARHTARAMVLYAFAGETLAVIKDPTLKAHLDHLISERLLKNI